MDLRLENTPIRKPKPQIPKGHTSVKGDSVPSKIEFSGDYEKSEQFVTSEIFLLLCLEKTYRDQFFLHIESNSLFCSRVAFGAVATVADLGNGGPLVLSHSGQLSSQITELLLDLRPLLPVRLHRFLVSALAVVTSPLVLTHVHRVIYLVRLLIILVIRVLGEQTSTIALELNQLRIKIIRREK